MSIVVWIILGVTAWVVLGSAVALIVGRMVRHRDRQVPHDARPDAAPFVPRPRDGSEKPSARSFEGPATHRSSPPP